MLTRSGNKNSSFASLRHIGWREVIFMEKRGRRPVLREKTAEMFDLPADVIAGVPKLEIVGDREFRMENHKGILSCSDEEIHISGGIYLVKISGQGLEVRAMTGFELLVTGKIFAVELN